MGRKDNGRTTRIIQYVQYALLYMLLFLMPISYHPIIMRMSEAAGYESGTILSKYVLVLFAILFLVSVLRAPNSIPSLLSKYLGWTALIAFSGIVLYLFYQNNGLITILRTFFIVFASIYIGWTIKLDRKHLTWILMVFSLTTLFSGLMQVFINIGGFRIANLYLTDSKNSLGAMLASSVVAFLFIFIDQDKRKLRLFSMICAFLGIIIILTIRARAALLCVFLVGLYMLMYNPRRKKLLPWIIGGGFALVVSSLILPFNLFDYMEQSVTAGAQGDDITSGRMHTYVSALNYFLSHPFIGDVRKETEIFWIHNFPLRYMYDYGLLFCWPVLGLYLYLIIFSFYRSSRTKLAYLYSGYTIMFIPYIISMLEPTFPFGPGTVTVFNFILLGSAERRFKYECKVLRRRLWLKNRKCQFQG